MVCDIIKYLGTWLDQHLQLVHHIIQKCRTAMINFQKIKLIWPVLNIDVTHTLLEVYLHHTWITAMWFYVAFLNTS